MPPPVTLIAGPTASGKSALARRLATERPSVIVNADSMQVYAELRILTARPTREEEAETPHRLYGQVPASERYSVGRWLADAASTLAHAASAGLHPIIVGGTGLYFRALTIGMAPVPPVPHELRAAWARRAEGMASPDLHRLLAESSNDEAMRVRPSDRSRILRALEVIDATGRTLPEWQADRSPPPLVDSGTARRFVLDLDRGELHRRIDARFAAMVQGGALAEAEAVSKLDLDPALPAMKAIGLRPLLIHLRGEIGLDEATVRGQAETRQCAKRQLTWFRNQMPDWPRFRGEADATPG